MANKRRVYRVAERIKELVALELFRMADPRFTLVTITSAIVSPDLRSAKLYWMVTGGEDRVEEVTQAFDHAAGLFRRVIARELDIRFAPELKFFYDDTLDETEKVLRLLARARETSGPDPVEGDGEVQEGAEEEVLKSSESDT